jgi:hypothetical protein
MATAATAEECDQAECERHGLKTDDEPGENGGGTPSAAAADSDGEHFEDDCEDSKKEARESDPLDG